MSRRSVKCAERDVDRGGREFWTAIDFLCNIVRNGDKEEHIGSRARIDVLLMASLRCRLMKWRPRLEQYVRSI